MSSLTDEQKSFTKARDKKINNSSNRSLVLVFGSGLNQNALGTVDDDKLKYLCSWNAILNRICEEKEIDSSQINKIKSYTAKWEKILRLIQQKSGFNKATYETESELIETLVAKLMSPQINLNDIPSAAKVYSDLAKSNYADICTINFDTLITEGSEEKYEFIERMSPISERRSIPESSANATSYFIEKETGKRVWYLHGTAKLPKTILLGTRRYGRYINALATSFQVTKENENLFLKYRNRSFSSETNRIYSEPDVLESWIQELRATNQDSSKPWAFPKSWVDLWMYCDIAFVGCGLGLDEFPLWWTLHQRSSNIARWPQELKPKTFYLYVDNGEDEQVIHLQGNPADITLVKYSSYEEMWNSILPPPTTG